MTKIYIVTEGTYSDFHNDAVFSSEEKANAYLAELKKISNDGPDMQEWELDTETSKIARESWRSTIDVVTGVLNEGRFTYISDSSSPVYEWGEPNQRAGDCTDLSEYPLKYGGGISEVIICNSFVSQEHADKLAVELRQDFLRRVDITKIKKRYPDIRYSSYFYDDPQYTDTDR